MSILKYIFLLLSILFIQRVYAQYDVCIYGGSSAGIIAAYTIKKMGKSVVVISADGHIGGLSTGGLGNTDIGNKNAIGGYSREFYRKLGNLYGQNEAWKFEPSKAKKVFASFIQEANIPIIYNAYIHKVEKKKGRITSIILKSEDRVLEVEKINAQVFMDCTYEGDLMAKSRVGYVVGREDNTLYNETLNGYYLAEYRKRSGYHQFPDGVSPYKVEDDPKSGLVWGLSKSKPSIKGKGDKLVQAYNFRICLTDSVENMIPIERPPDYDSTKYELLVRLWNAQPNDRQIRHYFIWTLLPNRKTDINNRGGFSTDMIGWSHNWPEATRDERKKIFDAHLSYTKGLLYFYKTDKRVPEYLQNYVSQWGYPKDEYIDNQHFTPQLYVREARRLVGQYVMSEQNCIGKIKVDDPIGMAAYSMDSHNTQRIVVNGMVKNEGNVEVGAFSPYPISYKAITPLEKKCANLLVPVCLSSTHIAYGSIRMEPVFMILGQSAGVAAVHAIDQKVSVQNIDYTLLKKELLKQNQILGL